MGEAKPVRYFGKARRSERVYMQIPVEVEGELPGGGEFRERTQTLIINRDGARISLVHSLEAGAEITVTNLQTKISCPFRVVARLSRYFGEMPEWGVECLNPDTDFWGIHFPPGVPADDEPDHVDALLECAACSTRELAKLSLGDYRELSSRGSLARDCQRCGGESEWEFGYIQALDQSPLPWEEPWAGEGGEEKRRAKRLAVRLPVRIRLPDGREEVARTENLSRMGVCFVSDMEMQAGDFMRMTLGYVLGESAGEEVVARVVWRRGMEGTNRFIYGVHLEEKA